MKTIEEADKSNAFHFSPRVKRGRINKRKLAIQVFSSNQVVVGYMDCHDPDYITGECIKKYQLKLNNGLGVGGLEVTAMYLIKYNVL